MTDDVAITVRGVSKTFKLPHEKQSSLKGALINFFRGGMRTYERQEVLKDISFEIKKGEFFGIVGRNGSGKSTLLKMLAGIYAPSAGAIKVNGRLTPFIELGVGFNPELTGRENVFLNGALLGFTRPEMQAMYDEIVAFAEIEKFMDQKLKNYSSGMQVRLAFSIAIKAQSDVLLLDEVLAVGDQNFQEKCFKYFEEVRKTNTTVILISHDSGAIERFCNRVAIIDRGKLVNVGEAREMVLQYGAIMAEEQYEGKSQKAHGGEHQGTGGVDIFKVEVLDHTEKPTRVLRAGEAFTVRAHYKLREPIDETVVVGIGVIDSEGKSILGPNTDESRELDVRLKSVGTVGATFAQNPISPGNYTITVGIFNKRSTFAYDLVEKAAQFKIVGEVRHGKIHIEPKWTIT